MIDIASETVVTLTNATDHLPVRRAGKQPHPSTIFRWAQRGCKGIRLESIQVGGTKCTSVEALQRFFDRLTNPYTPATAPTSKTRQKAIADAERELAEAGI
ncbi:MAG TPA: DUF1580 domain-containing protein [Thermoguttaceae bacterium]|nr:DUF1580 domain-containing protein [Thermoguttaceae bacterium]